MVVVQILMVCSILVHICHITDRQGICGERYNNATMVEQRREGCLPSVRKRPCEQRQSDRPLSVAMPNHFSTLTHNQDTKLLASAEHDD